MDHSNYHRFLRVASLVCAIALVFESGLVNDSTAHLSQNTHAYLASVVGMSASVQPTELNTYTAELTAKERELEAREAALREREIEVSAVGQTEDPNNETATYILASILFILLVLILLNYVLDYLRAREEALARTV